MPGGLSAHQSPNGPLAAGSVVGRAPCGAEVRHSWGAGSCSGLGCCSGYKKGAERDKKQYSAAQLSSSKPATSRRERHRVRKRKIQSPQRWAAAPRGFRRTADTLRSAPPPPPPLPCRWGCQAHRQPGASSAPPATPAQPWPQLPTAWQWDEGPSPPPASPWWQGKLHLEREREHTTP